MLAPARRGTPLPFLCRVLTLIGTDVKIRHAQEIMEWSRFFCYCFVLMGPN